MTRFWEFIEGNAFVAGAQNVANSLNRCLKMGFPKKIVITAKSNIILELRNHLGDYITWYFANCNAWSQMISFES